METAETDACLSSHPPRVVDGLLYVQREQGRYVVTDEHRSLYLGLDAKTGRIMQRLDGTQEPDALSKELDVPVEVIRYVINQLASLHLLETERSGADTSTQAQKKRSWVQRVLLIRKDLITRISWMDAAYQRLRLSFFFRPWLFVALFAIFLAAVTVWFLYSPVMAYALSHLLRPGAHLFGEIALGLTIYLATSFLHEVSHGFACTHFGGKVRSLGIAFFYFQPAWYCDVSDTWLFRKRYQRLITHAAGLMMNMFLTSLALLLLPLAAHTSWLLEPIAITFLISGMYALANLNPLIQLDGYYLLADALLIENLRENAFNTFYSSIRRMLYRVRLSKRPPALRRRRTRREQSIFLVYAALSLAYLAVLSWYLGTFYARFLTSIPGHYWNWLLFCLFLTIFIVIPFWQGWRRSGPAVQ
jgi:putative peptide zinc metalloprotease protein